jgi:group I intron endonuclease
MINKENLPNKSGIYKILCIGNNKIYIGSSKDIHDRVNVGHYLSLISNRHHNRHLQNSWDKYGEKMFEVSVVELCEESELLVREQYYLDLMFAQEYVLSKGEDSRFMKISMNLMPNAGRTTGWRASEEQRKGNSDRITAKWRDEEYLATQRAVRTPEWHRKRIAKIMEVKNGERSEEIKLKLSNSVRNSKYHISLRKPILVYNKDTGIFIQEYVSLRSCCKSLHLDYARVSKVLRGKIKFSYSYIFKYKTSDTYPLQIDPITTYYKSQDALESVRTVGKRNSKPILCYDLNDKFIGEYDSANDASRKLGIFSSGIRCVLYGRIAQTKGYKFKYKNGYIKRTYNKNKSTNIED